MILLTITFATVAAVLSGIASVKANLVNGQIALRMYLLLFEVGYAPDKSMLHTETGSAIIMG